MLLVAFPLLSETSAQCTSTETCLRAIATAQRETRTLTADFVQTKHLSLLEEPLESRGRFLFKRPDRIRLEITQPQPATVIVSGHDVHIPNLPESDRQAIAMAPVAAMFTQLGAIFTGSTEQLRDAFEVTAAPAEQDRGAIEVKLLPRLAAWQQLFRTIEVRFGGEYLMVQEIRLADALGDRLEVTLHNAKRNSDLPDALFRPSTSK